MVSKALSIVFRIIEIKELLMDKETRLAIEGNTPKETGWDSLITRDLLELRKCIIIIRVQEILADMVDSNKRAFGKVRVIHAEVWKNVHNHSLGNFACKNSNLVVTNANVFCLFGIRRTMV